MFLLLHSCACFILFSRYFHFMSLFFNNFSFLCDFWGMFSLNVFFCFSLQSIVFLVYFHQFCLMKFYEYCTFVVFLSGDHSILYVAVFQKMFASVHRRIEFLLSRLSTESEPRRAKEFTCNFWQLGVHHSLHLRIIPLSSSGCT